VNDQDPEINRRKEEIHFEDEHQDISYVNKRLSFKSPNWAFQDRRLRGTPLSAVARLPIIMSANQRPMIRYTAGAMKGERNAVPSPLFNREVPVSISFGYFCVMLNASWQRHRMKVSSS